MTFFKFSYGSLLIQKILTACSHNGLGKTTFCRRQNVAKPEVGSQRGEGFLAKRSKNRKQAIKDPTEASLPKLYEVAC